MNIDSFIFSKPKSFYDKTHQQLYYIPKNNTSTNEFVPVLIHVGFEYYKKIFVYFHCNSVDAGYCFD